jgi:RNA polymerase sigma-70 factor (family 1)
MCIIFGRFPDWDNQLIYRVLTILLFYYFYSRVKGLMEQLINGNDLLLQVIQGDAIAFGQLFQAYKDKLYSFIYHLSGSATIAEDVLQDVFLKIWRDRSQLDGIDNFNAYLYKMAQNHAINVLRRQSREALLLNEVQRLAPEGVQGHELLSAKEVQAVLQQAVNNLPPQQKKVYQLGREQGMKYEEIAYELNITVSTVRNHMVQALKAVREFIATNYPSFILYSISLLALMQ